MEIKQITPSESTHWYCMETGEPRYTVIGAKGQERNTTLADAKKSGGKLCPSVTSVIDTLKNEQIVQYRIKKAVLAGRDTDVVDGESDDDFASRAIEASKTHANDAASLGTDIHASLDKAYSGLPYNPEHDVYVKAVQEAVFLKYGDQTWIAEKSFAHPMGFGGKIDLASLNNVMDFKTTTFDEEKVRKNQVGGYDSHVMQLAAYATGLCIQNPILANVYVSTSVPGLVHILEYTEEEGKRGWDMFNLALQLWTKQKSYSAAVA